MQFGLILPHFGRFGRPERVLSAAKAAERAGFDSVWVRDHLVYEPHGFEDQDATFLEPFTTLAAVAAAAPSLVLGTAVIIPFRHPLVTAQNFLTLGAFATHGVIAGIGAGRFAHEFDAVGYPPQARFAMTDELGDVLRLAFTRDRFSYDGEHFRIPEVWLTPRPRAEIPILVGAQTTRALRRVARFDGWLASRLTYATFEMQVRQIREMRNPDMKPPVLAVVLLVSIADTTDAGRRALNVPALLADANRGKHQVRPRSGAFERFEDLQGIALAGTADEICEGVERFAALGARHLILDLRQNFAALEESVDRLGREVLSRYRKPTRGA
ncbi:MAG: LLM class flavin-dependent oxidoreductase [Armatimonadetes bacterium]|nr:LLM class flavin-dependent oxidoreductase [Armatimonadota bacterium]